VRHSLTQPVDQFSGLPACPYAEAAFERGDVSVIITEYLPRVLSIRNQIPPQGDQTYVIAWTRPERMSAAAFDQWIERHNERHQGIWLMGFHPEAEGEPGIPAVPVEIESDYAVILMQRLDTVAGASDRLKRTGYYEGYTDAEWQAIAWRDECARDPSVWESVAAGRAANLPGGE